MVRDEYEKAIGNLVLLKQYTTQNHHAAIDLLIEQFVDEFIERNTRNEL